MADNNLQKPLETLSSMLNHIVAEPICEHFSRQWRDGDPCALSFKYVAEVFKIGVAAPDGAVFELKGGDIGPADDLIVGVHTAGCAVGLRVLHLW